MNVQQAIMDRRSTRGFDGAPLTDAEIKTLVDAALQSPSAMNRQPWHFAFVKNPGSWPISTQRPGSTCSKTPPNR